MSRLVPRSLDRLACDGPLPTALYTPGKFGAGGVVLLLAKGTPLTPELIERLRRRGVYDLIADAEFVPQLTQPKAGDAASPAREPVPVGGRSRAPADAFIRTLTRPAGGDLKERERAAVERRDALARGVGSLYAEADPNGFGAPTNLADEPSGLTLRGVPALSRRIDGEDLRALSKQALADLCEDFDLFTAVGLASPESEIAVEASGPSAVSPLLVQLRRHAVRTTHLALAIGVVAGLRKWELSSLAVGCLVHDAGMVKIDPALWYGPDRLNSTKFTVIAEHPRHTLEMLKGVPGVSAGARAVAVQMHERADGSGYPYR
ncbi:MAG: HD domain-containing phosphohydrolase, partial [Planctomycetota bacterium]